MILSTGARWREMNVPGEQEYRNKGVTYCPHCDGPLFKGKRVAVIGGGNSGVEAAIDLAGIVGHVTLLEFDSELRADEVLQRKLRSLPNVDVIVSAQTTEVTRRRPEGHRPRPTPTAPTATAAQVELEGVFVQIGLVPNTEWLKGTHRAVAARRDRGRRHAARPRCRACSPPATCTTVPFKQIVIAMGDGAKAALSAFDHLIRLPVAEEALVA